MTQPSEFDLRPTERKMECGCYVELIGETWRVTGQAFLCPDKHRLYAPLAPEIVAAKSEARRSAEGETA